MGVVPNSKLEILEFFEHRAPIWSADPPAIGLTLDQVSALTAALGEAQSKNAASYTAREASRTATAADNVALDTLTEIGAQLIKIIRAYAIQTGDPGVFETAQIPAPKDPEPIAPVNPSNVAASLLTSGALELKWDGVKSHGTTFVVLRSIVPGPGEPATPLAPIASVGAKRYEDNSIPAGTVSATYVVKAIKGEQTTAGSLPATVNFSYNQNDGQQQLQIAA